MAVIHLPIVVRRQRWALMYGLLWTPYIAVYQAVNRYPVFEPRELDMMWLDHVVPFVPELLPLYVAYIPFFWWTAARSENDETATRFFYATHFQLGLSAAAWILFPVRMPRELFYSPEVYNWADQFWRWFDAPNNCFPSLHAANCLLFMQFNRKRSWSGLHTGIAAAIIASTVLVKQHYVVDLVAGTLVYAVSHAVLAHLRVTGIGKSRLGRKEAHGSQDG